MRSAIWLLAVVLSDLVVAIRGYEYSENVVIFLFVALIFFLIMDIVELAKK
jgi:hypothetical protein